MTLTVNRILMNYPRTCVYVLVCLTLVIMSKALS